MLETLSTEKMADKIATAKKAKTKISKGERLNLISLSQTTILANQQKNARETKKNNKYCLLYSKASKLKGKKKSGIKKVKI